MPEFFFDAIIAIIIGSIPILLISWFRPGAPPGGWRPLIASVLALLWVTVFYGSFIEPKLLTVKRYPIVLHDGGRRLRIAVVSDTHLGIYQHRDWTERVVRGVNALQPDLVILDGDLVTIPQGLDALEPFGDLKSRFGTFAALGNWDYRVGAIDVRSRLGSYGVKTLTNRSVQVGADPGTPVRLIGLDDFRYGSPDWDAAMSEVPAGAITILAVHNPDFAPQAEVHGIDLTIASHTHCGQIRLPLIGPLAPLPDSLGRRFDCGVFRYGPMSLFITPGAGESGTRARLFDPPEISLLDVTL